MLNWYIPWHTFPFSDHNPRWCTTIKSMISVEQDFSYWWCNWETFAKFWFEVPKCHLLSSFNGKSSLKCSPPTASFFQFELGHRKLCWKELFARPRLCWTIFISNVNGKGSQSAYWLTQQILKRELECRMQLL